jgi:hypothetical protein
MNSATASPGNDWRNRPVDSSIYSQYDHLDKPIKVGDLVQARGANGPITCEVERLMADGLYVKTISVKSRLSSLLPPSAVRNINEVK